MQLKIHNQNYSAERIDRNNRCLSVFHYQKSRLKYSRGTSWPLKFVVINQKIKNPCLWFQFHIYQDLSVAAIICKCEMSEWSRKECFFKSALEKSPCKNSWSSLFWLWKTAPILYRDQLSLLKPEVRTARLTHWILRRGDDGFEMLSISFPDINECEFSVDEEDRLPLTRHNRHNCTQPHSKCVNVKGSYKCE